MFLLLLLPSLLFADEPVIRVGLTGIGKPNQLTVKSDQPFKIGDTELQSVTLTLDDGEISAAWDMGHMGPMGPMRLIPLKDDAIFEIVSPKVRCARYRGILEISGGKALSVVNELPLEDYVRGVIPIEVPASFQPEAQKALAIAIRTYALKSLDRHKSSGFNMCDSVHCQGFAGASRDAKWVDKLIDDTRGQILVYKGQPIYAVYSSDCGGVTQNNEDAGYGPALPYLRSVGDRPNAQLPTSPAAGGIPSDRRDNSQLPTAEEPDYCAGCPYHTWTKTFKPEELDKAFSNRIGKFQSIEFSECDCSGRVKTVVIKGEDDEYKLTGGKFRELFGESVIKSALMTLTVNEDGECVIEGKGFGHGVGLCAFGANGMAKSGKTCEEILKHYYTGAEVKKISDIRFRIAD